MKAERRVSTALVLATLAFVSAFAGLFFYRLSNTELGLEGADYVESSGSYEYLTGSGGVNINTASLEELMVLPGIGETRARSIIKYREGNGDFESIADVCEVTGIGEGVYADIRELICIK